MHHFDAALYRPAAPVSPLPAPRRPARLFDMVTPRPASAPRISQRAALPALVVGLAAIVGVGAAVSLADPAMKRAARTGAAASAIIAPAAASGFEASPLMICSAVVLAALMWASARTPSVVFAPPQPTGRIGATPIRHSPGSKVRIAYHFGGLYGP
jgi:hypothetical protein